jgi:hypothetical protein
MKTKKTQVGTVIRIDPEVRGVIRREARPWEPVNAVLRRLLGLDKQPKKETDSAPSTVNT